MRPDDLGARIVRQQNRKRRVVTMSQNIETVRRRELHRLLDQRRGSSVSVDVELADTAEISTLVLALDQIVDRGIARPALHVLSSTIRSDEWHHPQILGLGIDQLVGA